MKKSVIKRRFRQVSPFSLALASALLFAAPVFHPASEAPSLPYVAALQCEDLFENVLVLPGGEPADGGGDEGSGGSAIPSTDGEAVGNADGAQSGADGEVTEAPGEKSVDVRGVFLILLISAATVSGIVSGIPRDDRV